jgi:NAD(P)-dependent dehydrogenase (short-subunit alcohol dehydrogenase family)
MKLEGRIAIVTGAARGIGRACAERFLAEGASVVIADVDAARLAETAREIGPPDRVLAVVTDVARKEEVEALVTAAVRRFGRLDIMVNNAGIAPVRPFLEVTKDEYDKVLAVNLEGAFWGTQAAARQMIAQGRDGARADRPAGVIINMSSINSGLANPNVATYAITKAGMNQITGTAAVAFAPHGIRVVGVGPGTIDTEMVRGAFVASAGDATILARTPLGRYGRADEIAAVVAFLASDDASYITGETIYPDGGRRVLNYVMPKMDPPS